jgi:hypothetical protein
MSRMVVKRQWSDLSSFAHDQLDARNSEFADAPDFRVYKFAKGKWPEFALRTVVSAHQERMAYIPIAPETRNIGRIKTFKYLVFLTSNSHLPNINSVKRLPKPVSEPPQDKPASSHDSISEDNLMRKKRESQENTEAVNEEVSQQNADDGVGVNQDPPNPQGYQFNPIKFHRNGPVDSDSASENIRSSGERTEAGDKRSPGPKSDT